MYISLRDDPRYNYLLVLTLLVGWYLTIYLAVPRLPQAYIGNLPVSTYVIQPLLWLLIALVVYFLPRYRPAAKPTIRRTIIQIALFIALFQISLYVIGGLFSSFGHSPYPFSPLGIAGNIFFVGSMLVGMELSRAWLVNRLGKKHTFLALVFVALLYTMLNTSLAKITGLSFTAESVSFLTSSLLPLLARNLLATVLAYYAGPLASIAYIGLLQAFWWFVPILPDLPWAIESLIGVVVPILGWIVVHGFYQSKTERIRARRVKEGSLIGWVIATVISVSIIWFSVGLFPVHPALVLSGSMRPVMDAGDVAIIVKVDSGAIKEGDIIQFRLGDITVMHRVVEIVETGGSRSFITKGDDNERPDPNPTTAENLIGKTVFTIPKIGWVGIAIKDLFTG